jgi:hypothetical protein
MDAEAHRGGRQADAERTVRERPCDRDADPAVLAHWPPSQPRASRALGSTQWNGVTARVEVEVEVLFLSRRVGAG